jgi:hypothetical protein
MSGALRFEKNADGRPQGSSIALEQPQRVARAINLDLVEHCIAAIAPVASGLASRAAFSALAGESGRSHRSGLARRSALPLRAAARDERCHHLYLAFELGDAAVRFGEFGAHLAHCHAHRFANRVEQEIGVGEKGRIDGVDAGRRRPAVRGVAACALEIGFGVSECRPRWQAAPLAWDRRALY